MIDVVYVVLFNIRLKSSELERGLCGNSFWIMFFCFLKNGGSSENF